MNKTKTLPKHLQDSKKIYGGKVFSVHTKDMQANHKTLAMEVVVHPGAAVILPLLDNETVLMIQNQRHCVGQTLWELPAGTLEEGEKPMETAKRELCEETGYRAGSISLLMNFYTTPGFCTEKIFAFVAKNLSFKGTSLDPEENISTHPLKWDEIFAMLRKQTIIDAKTIAVLLYHKSKLGNSSS